MTKIMVFLTLLLSPVPAVAQDTIYIIEHAPGGEVARKSDGMTLAQVQALMAVLTTNPYDVVDEATYDAAVAASDRSAGP